MPSYKSRWPVYARQWDAMHVTRVSEARKMAEKILLQKDRYVLIERLTGVPWYWTGPTHVRESDMDFRASIAQGDRWDRVSRHVPAGRGPFPSFEAAAEDAYRLDGLSRVVDWRLEKLLYYWEVYNGWGYLSHGVPSAYVWAGSDQYSRGKYISDGHWSSSAVDHQLGTATMLRALMDLDKTIKIKRET